MDNFLRRFHYELFLLKPCHWKRKSGLQTGGALGQLIHADVVYFLNVDYFIHRVSSFDPRQRLSKILKFIILAALYGYYDLAFQIMEVSMKKGYLNRTHEQILRHELNKNKNILMRIPKLRGRGVVPDLIYHVFMIMAGIWVEKRNFWKLKVQW